MTTAIQVRNGLRAAVGAVSLVDPVRDMAAYDELAPEVRAALAGADFKQYATPYLSLSRTGYPGLEDNIRRWDRAERGVGKMRSIWGGQHPQAEVSA